jgi:hypothetical protein
LQTDETAHLPDGGHEIEQQTGPQNWTCIKIASKAIKASPLFRCKSILLVLKSNRAKTLYKRWDFKDTGSSMAYGNKGDTLLLYKYAGERFKPGSGGAGRA